MKGTHYDNEVKSLAADHCTTKQKKPTDVEALGSTNKDADSATVDGSSDDSTWRKEQEVDSSSDDDDYNEWAVSYALSDDTFMIKRKHTKRRRFPSNQSHGDESRLLC